MTLQKIVGLLICVLLSIVGGSAQNAARTATSVRVELQGIYGSLFVTIGTSEKKITEQAQKAWIINDGRHVVYSSSDGAGGFENEGQGLHLYDVSTGRHKRILSEYFAVDDVKETVTSTKKRALLVSMSDGGLGASYVAVVDPSRGEVFYRPHARIMDQKGDIIVLGFYKEDDWEKLNAEPPEKVRPYKSERHNLNSLLQRRVIVNKKDTP